MNPPVTAWIERYERTWETNDPAATGDLLAEHALYYSSPDTEPWRDRNGIVVGWLEPKNGPGTWKLRYQVLTPTAGVAFGRLDPLRRVTDERQQPVGDSVRRGGTRCRVYGMVDGARPAGRTQLRGTHERGGA